MTSQERIHAALRCQPVDQVPCAPWFFNSYVAGVGQELSAREMIEYLLNELGTDAHVKVEWQCDQSLPISGEFWKTEDDQVFHKVFRTPSGDLSASIRDHETILVKDDLPLSSDFNPPAFIKPWIENMQDVECFRHICSLPDERAIAAFHDQLAPIQGIADEFAVPIVGHVGMGLTLLLQMMGGERAVYASIDQPELLHRFMQIEHKANLAKMEIMLDAGVDIICRNGFYETCDFWSPAQVAEFILPYVNEEARLVHSLGGVMVYTVCTGVEPLLDLYLESEIDCFEKIETKLTSQRLKPIAAKLAGKKCIWGGLSDCEDLGHSTPDQTRQAVREAFQYVGRRGLILGAGPSIKKERPWENVLAMIDEWKALR